MNKKIYIYLFCTLNVYSSTELSFGGKVAQHSPEREVFVTSDDYSAFAGKPFVVLPSNGSTPHRRLRKHALTYKQRLLNGSFDRVLTETPKPSPQKRTLRYPDDSVESVETPEQSEDAQFADSSSPGFPTPDSESGTSDHAAERSSASDEEQPDDTVEQQTVLIPPLRAEALMIQYEKERSFLMGVNDVQEWLGLTDKIAGLQYQLRGHSEYVNVFWGV